MSIVTINTIFKWRLSPPCFSTRCLLVFMLFAINFFGGQQLQAQSPPGNVTTDLTIWYDAGDVNGDDNYTNNPVDSTEIMTWVDKSGNGNDAVVATGKNGAILETDPFELINGKPVLKFNQVSQTMGSIYGTGIDVRASVMEDMTIFLVYKPKTAVTGSSNWQSPWGNDNGAWDRFYYSSFGTGSTSNNPETGIVSLGTVAPSSQAIPEAGKVDEVYLQTTAYNGDLTGGSNSGPIGGSAVYFNGDLVQAFTDNTDASNAYSELSIGWDGDSGAFDGQIAEVMVYSRILTACELEQINNALGLKYGKDFSGFTASYDPASFFNVNPNAIGISASACGGSVQVDEAASSQVTINNPTSNDTENEFLIFAHNDISGEQLSTNIPVGTTIRMDRVWRVEEETNTNNNTGVDLGLVDVVYDLATIGLTNVGVDEYVLLIDSEGTDFSDATIYESSPGVKVIGAYANGKVTFSGINLDHDDHFTLAVLDNITPTVTVEQSASQADPYYENFEVRFTATFSEPMDASTFTCSDLIIGGTATSGCTSITEVAPFDKTTYEILITATTIGTVTVEIPANTVQDFGLNDNSQSTSTDNSVTIRQVTWQIGSITPAQNGSEDGTDVVYVVNLIDDLGSTYVNNTNATITASIAFTGSADQSDFTTTFPTFVSIADGMSSATVTLIVNDDTTVDPNENITATLSSPLIGMIDPTDFSDLATIDDNDDDDGDGVENSVDQCEGFDDNLDADLDGVPNACDLDDDNDGILDLEECPISITNIAPLGTASQSSEYTISSYPASNAIDDNLNNFSHTKSNTSDAWWEVDLGSDSNIDEIVIYNRVDCCKDRLTDAYVLVSSTPFPADPTDLEGALANAEFTYRFGNTASLSLKTIITGGVTAQYVRVQLSGGISPNLNFAEVQVLNYSLCNSDGDALSDLYDLDSDNDGCSDALEGAGSFTIASIENDTLTGGVDVDGIPILASGGQGVGESSNATIAACLCPFGSGNDNDGDGLDDTCDLDDDNDGILDIAEGACEPQGASSSFWDGANEANDYSSLILDGSLSPQSTSMFGSGVVPTMNTFHFTLQGVDQTSYAGAKADNDYTEYSFTTEVLASTTYLVTDSLRYQTEGLGTELTFSVEISANGFTTSRLLMQDVDVTTLGAWTNVSFPDFELESSTTYTIRAYMYNSIATNTVWNDFAIYYKTCEKLDTDGDDITNDLDLDSDGDGCSDALEGGGSFSNTQILNDTLTGGVDTDGIPNLAGSSGQTIGESANASIANCCGTGTITYAITDGSNNTTGYQWDEVGSPSEFPSTLEYGLHRSTDYCEDGTWRHYYNTNEPDIYLFSVEMQTNTTEIDYIDIRVAQNASDRYDTTATNAMFTMSRDWHVETLGGVALTAPVNIRFYYPPSELQAMLDAAIALSDIDPNSTAPTAGDIVWFKKEIFNPSGDIDATGSSLTNGTAYEVLSPVVAAGANGVASTESSAIGNNTNYIQFNGLTNFSGGTAYVLVSGVALPVELSSFKAKSNGCDIDLTWSTETEKDFDYFDLEWSGNGQDFRSVKIIAAEGGDFTQVYTYRDEDASSYNYYRLKMVDLDGSYEYSNIVSARPDCKTNNEVTIYPNPVGVGAGILNVEFYSERQEAQIQITDMLGRVVQRLRLDVEANFVNTIQIDISDLPSGNYTIQVVGDEKSKMFIISE